MDPITLGILQQFVDVQMVCAVILIVEFLKIYIPDNLEAKVLPPISVVVGGLLSLLPQLHSSIIVGLVSGFAATSAYQLGQVGLSKIAEAGKTVVSALNAPK